MCLANTYLDEKAKQAILDNIAYAKFDDDQVELKTLLEESKILRGKEKEIDFLKSSITSGR
jgi:predicted RNA-binding protein